MPIRNSVVILGAMTPVKGGLKVQPPAEGACTPLGFSHPPPLPKPGESVPNLCGIMLMNHNENGDMTIDVRGSALTQLAQRLSVRADRPIIDITAISRRFNFHLEFTPDPNPRGQSAPVGPYGLPLSEAGPSLFAALSEQIGLKLSPDRGPVSFLIVDHAERPFGELIFPRVESVKSLRA